MELLVPTSGELVVVALSLLLPLVVIAGGIYALFLLRRLALAQERLANALRTDRNTDGAAGSD